MKKFKNLTLGLFFALTGGVATAQNGLENVLVERYYVSDAADAVGSVGTLPARSVTYRVYADLLPGYKFQAMYGVPGHSMTINTSTSFFNNEDRGNTNPAIGAAFINDNSVAIDSWFSVGGAANGNLGILKSEDNGAANLITGNTMLLNNDTAAGIPLTTQDGIIAGTPVAVTFVGLTTELDVFNATSQVGNSFTTSNGSIAALGGSTGPVPATNRVLIGQFTTDGTFHFELNIQIGTPSSGTQNFVAVSPAGAEISIPSLIYTSTPLSPLATTSVTYCEGATASALSATADPSCTLNWYTVPTGGTASTTAPVPSTAAAGTTTYYVSQTNGVNESYRTAITVVVNPTPSAPTITPGSATTFCAGGSVVLTSSAAYGNIWSTSDTTTAITANSTATYTVMTTNSFGCTSASGSITVTANPLPATPTITPSASTSICAGSSVDLTSSAASGNLWTTTETTSTITVNTAGSYGVTVTDGNGCSATSTTVVVSVTPVPTAAGVVASITGSTVTFMNMSTGATSYVWNFGDATTDTASNPVHTYPTNGNYTVTLVAINGGCSDTITFNTLISVGVTEAQVVSEYSIFPNPASQVATVKISLTEATAINVNVYDITGKIVVNVFTGTMQQGINNLNVNVSELPAGIYFTKVESNNVKKTMKLVVVK